MRATCLNMVYDLAKRDRRVLFSGSDLSPGLRAEMQNEMPERWAVEGITGAIVSREEYGFAIGKAIPMRRARSRRSIALMATGVMTTNSLAAADLLAKDGHDVSVVHFHTIKPLDAEAVLEFARDAELVVTVEE